MEPKIIKSAKGPEWYIRRDIINMLKIKGWHVEIIHGNAFTNGMPDLFATHHRYGIRLIEAKNPIKYSFTAAQLETFPLLCAHGAPVYILVAATEYEYDKLFKKTNWYFFLECMK